MAFEIREIYEYELQGSLNFARAMFDGQIAYSLESQDRDDFYKSTDFENVYAGLRNGSLYIYGGFAYGAMVALAAVSPNGKISFFLVNSNYQNSGVETELFESIKYKYATGFRLGELYADVPQILIPMYQYLGFQFSDEAPTKVISRFAKMRFRMQTQYSAIPEPGWVQNDRKKQYILLGVIIAIVVALIVGAISTGLRVVESPIPGPEPDDPPPKIDQEREDKGTTTENPYLLGLDIGELSFIEEKIALGVPYTLNEGLYQVFDTSDEGGFIFIIEYPIIGGLEDEEVQDKINEDLRACAMVHKDEMYPVLSDSLLNMADDNYYRFESAVECRIAYLDINIISVVFFDQYSLGSNYNEFADMRALTFDLRTGELYELHDLMFPDGDVNDRFIDDFRAKLIAENPDSKVFNDMDVMSNDTLERILLGEVVDNRYFGSYFFTYSGPELFVTYHYRSNESGYLERGYVTTHYDYDELLPYKKQHDLWEVLPY